MATSMMSIGGLSSGLDTQSIVSQLMQIERIPLTRYQSQQNSLKKVDTAWGTITTKLSGLRTALDAIAKRTAFAAHVSTTSSDSTVVTATKTGAPSTGAVTFTVDRLATTHQVAAGQALSGPDALVGAGNFTVTLADGTSKTVVTDSSTTLTQLKEKVGALGAGVNATVLQTASNSYRLVLTGASSGAAGAFTIAETPPGMDNTQSAILTQGQDAKLTVGTGAGALTVLRSKNTVTDLIDGVTLNLQRVSTAQVTVSTSRDDAQTTKSVKDVVDAFKGVFTTIADLTKYDATTKTAGVLQGNGEARKISSDLRGELMTRLQGAYTSAGDLGISFDKTGAIQFDEAKFNTALQKDYNGVLDVLSKLAVSTSDTRVSYVGATDATTSGVHALKVTRAADVAKATSAAYTRPTVPAPHKFRITSGAAFADITLDRTTGLDLPTALNTINNSLAAAGITSVRAVADSTNSKILLQETRVGSANSFTVTNTGTTALWTTQTVAGVDVQATVGTDATVHTGSGYNLTVGSGAANGLSVSFNLAAGAAVPADMGTVTVGRGIIGLVSDMLKTTEGEEGRVKLARDGVSRQIRRLDDTIASFERRLEMRETTLRRKFTALETALSRSQSQAGWLAGQLGTSK